MARRVRVRDILIYSDRVRVRTGERRVLEMPISDVVFCINGLNMHDTYGNAYDTIGIVYGGAKYLLTLPGGIGNELINALRNNLGIMEIHTCGYLGVK